RPVQPPRGASLEPDRVAMQNRARPETSVIQSVAGAPLAGSLPPAPAERSPAVRQAGRRSPVAEREIHHKIGLFHPSSRAMAAILPLAFWQNNPESAYRRF
ncbi:hypothetical protein ID854_16265, partial [Xenorhabdus sp. M]|nr:hypothetical protein [Xenorhabdus sp. M]